MATTAREASTVAPPASLRLPGIVLGVGLGEFVDGILLHQFMRWHSLLDSNGPDLQYAHPDTVTGLRMNSVWDGVFHAMCWLSLLTGLGLLHARVTRNRRRIWAARALWGWILAGWGLFNLVDGIVDHHILGIHHIHAGPRQLWWDIGYLVLSALMVAGGYLLQRSARPAGRAI
ncbi:DUF2243 domain-containing protein [Amycolatopsis cynarae]|uniref:DUF2243 domain-containing protein n=1 Tax=Amycolatopsis cynarae TaxID=2995223 RepID=A0ABY7BAU4_9PSEU|nr:DUF2243 domain-containing protein [Amycolatopsis sp. HUAS 11-8]WAL69102.1 DUF2243 domain-containing protein [Amycolatopsis sp. HUAS 11-8]